MLAERLEPISLALVSDSQLHGDLGDLPFLAGLPPVLDVGRQYANAPIVEATIDLWVEGDPDFSISDLTGVLDGLEFSGVTEIYEESSSDWDEAHQRTTSRTVSGYRAKSADGSHGVIVTRHNFSFSRIGRYGDWASFLSSAEECWHRYRKVAAPQSVSRASVRYVNLIRTMKDAFEIRDYLRTSFEMSPYLPQMVSEFYCQVRIPLPEILPDFTPTAVIAVGSPQVAGMVLDIAVGVDVQLDTQNTAFSSDLTGVLTKLRHAKNYVFESCITDATRSLIS